MELLKLFAASSRATFTTILPVVAFIFPIFLVSSTGINQETQASNIFKRSLPECSDGYGWADFKDCARAIELLSTIIPEDEISPLFGAESFEFLGVDAPSQFEGYRKIQTPLKQISGQLKLFLHLDCHRGTRTHFVHDQGFVSSTFCCWIEPVVSIRPRIDLQKRPFSKLRTGLSPNACSLRMPGER